MAAAGASATAAASSAGPSTSAPQLQLALDALAEAAPRLLQLPGPDGVAPAALGTSALQRLQQQLQSVSQGSWTLEEVADALTRRHVTLAAVLLFSKPVLHAQTSRDVQSDRHVLRNEVLTDAQSAIVGLSKVLIQESILSLCLPPAPAAQMAGLCRRLLRAGMLRAVACSLASAAAAITVAPGDAQQLRLGLCAAHTGSGLVGFVAMAAGALPQLAEDVAAALADSAVLDHLGRLVVLCLASPAWVGLGRPARPHSTCDLSGGLSVVAPRLLDVAGAAPRYLGLLSGWPLHALLVLAVCHLSKAEPGAPGYGLPPELLAGARELLQPSDAGALLQALARVLAAADGTFLRGYGRRGPMAVVLRAGDWAVRSAAAGGDVGAAGLNMRWHSLSTALAMVSAASNLLHGSALEAAWERDALAGAWRLARDAAAAGTAAVVERDHNALSTDLAHGLGMLLGAEAERGAAYTPVLRVLP
jgi:hypothetical protein